MQRSSGVLTAVLCASLGLPVLGCKDKPLASAARAVASAHQGSSASSVLLEGTFQRVAKVVSGKVRIERHGEKYELVVNPASIPDIGPVHVYLVGLPAVRSTADIDSVEAKYDFGPIEQTGSNEYVAEQRITLPGKPAPELRSVALINPRFGVVLGASSLREPR
jgi:hypothetical protein